MRPAAPDTKNIRATTASDTRARRPAGKPAPAWSAGPGEAHPAAAWATSTMPAAAASDDTYVPPVKSRATRAMTARARAVHRGRGASAADSPQARMAQPAKTDGKAVR